MGVLEDLLAQQAQMTRAFGRVHDRLEALERRENLSREWYKLSELPALKGIGKSKLEHERYLQPLGGNGRRWVGGCLRWSRSVVAEWLTQDDETLAALYGRRRHRSAGIPA